MAVGLLEKMSTNVVASSAQPSSLLLHSTILSLPPLPVSIPRLPFQSEKLQSCSSSRMHHHLPFTSLEPGGNPDCSPCRKIPGGAKKGRFVVCSSYGNNGATTKPPVSEQEEGMSNGDVSRSLRSSGTAVVWFKRDLRLDDHPGLMMATSSYEKVLPLYVFDPVPLAGWSAELVKALWDAVHDLRKSLQAIGSDLVIRFGRTPNVLRAIAREVEASDIITEEEVEMEWYQLVRSVSGSLSEEADAEKDTLVKQWRSSIYEIEGLEELPDCYKKFQGQKYPYAAPLDPPAFLPTLPDNFDRGLLPSVEEIFSAIATVKSKDLAWEELKGAQELDAELLLGARSPIGSTASIGQVPPIGALKNLAAWRERYILANPYEALEKKRKESAPVLAEEDGNGYVLKGGATGALNILKGYLRFLEPTGRGDWQEISEHIMRLEKRPGASFRAIFGNALVLGTLSLRRIYQEAMEYERARGGGWLSPFGFSSLTAAAAIRDSKAIEWYQLLALKSREQGREQGFQVGTWRWRGFLIQYALAGTSGPPVVFVHGFGAFWQHWRDNIKSVAESGHRVFALTMLGFGRSEKPLITYTDLVWGELLRDFVVEVVREPAVMAGNSIGGYTVSVVAGLWPSLVKSVVLLNSAGRVIPDYKALKYNKPRDKSSVAYVGSRLLLAYLQNLSNGMLTKCYPSSYDPNATAVLEAMFHLRAPLPLNYYLDRYEGDILIIQGMRDPLHNSSKRASMLQAYCKNVSIQYINAGHCPHDEVPEDVNLILTTWLKERTLKGSQISQSIAVMEDEFANGSSKVTLVKEPKNGASASESGHANGAPKAAKPVKESIPSFNEETNGAVPDVITRLKEEVEELV